jgi:diguanylate cyclase (GGDEF)-like protein
MHDAHDTIESLKQQLDDLHRRVSEMEGVRRHSEQVEAAMAEMVHRNQMLGDSAPFGIFALDLEGRITGLNRKMRDLLPWPDQQDPTGLSILNIKAMVDAGVGDDFQRCIQTRRAMIRDYECVDNGGSCLQLRFHLSPVLDGGVAVLGVLAFVENHTHLKLAQVAAQESEQRYRELFQSAPIALVERDASALKAHLEALRLSGIVDLKGFFQDNPAQIERCMAMIKTTDCNNAFMELLQVRDKQSLEATLPRMAMEQPGFQSMVEQIIFAVADGQLPPERELTLRTAQGSLRHIISKAIVLAGHESTMARIVISLVDITTRMEAEEALRASEQRFRRQSLRDNLTGLYNQRHLYASLPLMLQAALTRGLPVSLLFMDLDNFKAVVDTHGHLNGSRAIQEVAATISSALVAPAYAVAYAGDEFVVVLPDFDPPQALEKAKELQGLIKNTEYLSQRGLSVQLQASCGIATFPADANNPEALLTAADTALFKVKGTVKGAIGQFDRLES